MEEKGLRKIVFLGNCPFEVFEAEHSTRIIYKVRPQIMTILLACGVQLS